MTLCDMCTHFYPIKSNHVYKIKNAVQTAANEKKN